MKAALLIPHYHKNEQSTWLLYTLLDSIERYEPELLKSTVILDDASPITDRELKQILSPYPVSFLRRKTNAGYSKNINMGLSFLAKNGVDYAFVLNNDLVLTTPVSQVLRYFEHVEGLAVVGIRLWFPDGRLQHGGIEVDASNNVHHAGYRSWDGGLGTRFVHCVTGAFQCLKISQVGAYPEEYPLSYEDVAFCLRNWERGNRVLYTDAVSAIHAESATRGYLLGPKEWESLSEFHRAEFQFPEVERQLQRARESMSHEKLCSLLPHQPPLQYVRDHRTKHQEKDHSIRKAGWDLARVHRKLAPVGPGTMSSSSHRRATPGIHLKLK